MLLRPETQKILSKILFRPQEAFLNFETLDFSCELLDCSVFWEAKPKNHTSRLESLLHWIINERSDAGQSSNHRLCRFNAEDLSNSSGFEIWLESDFGGTTWMKTLHR
jgi:hypothetical protein